MGTLCVLAGAFEVEQAAVASALRLTRMTLDEFRSDDVSMARDDTAAHRRSQCTAVCQS
jgi:hypothetical protein